MRINRVGASGFEVSDLALGAFEWGHRVGADTAQELVDAYADAGGSLLEIPSFASPAADVVGALTIPRGMSLLGRVGVVAGRGRPRLSCGRATILLQIDELLRRTGREHIDLLVLEGFDELTPLEETASALSTLLTAGKVVHIGLAHHEGWQLAVAQAAGIPVVAALNELSLLERGAETAVLPAAEYLGIGVIAGAALGRGILTGKYAAGVPRDSRAAGDAGEWVGRRLTEDSRHLVAGVAKAAVGLGVEPIDIALAWNRTLPVASSLIAPRTPAQLDHLLRSDLELEQEIRDVLDQVSAV